MNRTRTSKNAKRLLVWLLTLTMVFGLLPMAAFADETVVEPVVNEEPVQEPEPSSESTEAPSEPTQEPETISELEQPGNADVTIEGDEEQPEDDTDAEDEITTLSTAAIDGFDYSIVMVDCGRRYFTVDELKTIIYHAGQSGMHYVMLAVGNDCLRFLLDDMSITVGEKTYESDAVKKAIKEANYNYGDGYAMGDGGKTRKINYYNESALTETEMNTLMKYAYEQNVEIIPLINTPGHMDSIIKAAKTLGAGNFAYSSSSGTIDVTNTAAVEFTQALLKKYIAYFSKSGCTLFNMGADEYGNDINWTPQFNAILQNGGYTSYIAYLNAVSKMIETAGMKAMAFNDGIYYNESSIADTLNRNILVCYWSPGWTGYDLASASYLRSKGFNLINTNGDYYWVLGKSAQCSAEKRLDSIRIHLVHLMAHGTQRQ